MKQKTTRHQTFINENLVTQGWFDVRSTFYDGALTDHLFFDGSSPSSLQSSLRRFCLRCCCFSCSWSLRMRSCRSLSTRWRLKDLISFRKPTLTSLIFRMWNKKINTYSLIPQIKFLTKQIKIPYFSHFVNPIPNLCYEVQKIQPC